MSDLTWRALQQHARDTLAAAGIDDAATDARRIVEQASGHEGADLVVHLDDAAPARNAATVHSMIERRALGEPLQYVLGRWGFRTLDVFVDRRVLIPRPETEVVAGVAIDALRALGRNGVAVDLGTGSGVIALSIAAELWPHVEVWATDVSVDAIAVARANLAGLGRRAAAIRLVEGDWFDALPSELAGRLDVVVSNPPYVAATDELPAEVVDWEPHQALVSGDDGLEAIALIVEQAPRWLAPGGTLVVEIGDTQGDAATTLAERAGLRDVEVRPDLTGRPRVLLARA